jgi:hypothetical protein
MQFIFDFTAFYYNTPVFYKISKLGNQEYFAEPADKNMRPFTLKKQSGYWISESGYSHRHAIQIGETIDKLQGAGINK